MASEEIVLQCYNKSCGEKFYPKENTEDSCQFHPGVPVFHDALKGWSCCKKRTTDFTDFLKIPGCTKGLHNPVKPKETPKPEKNNKAEDTKEIPTISTPPPPPVTSKVQDIKEQRPSDDEPLQILAIKTTASYKKSQGGKVTTEDDGEIKIGTSCRNSGCKATFVNGPKDKSDCVHHPGTAVFHEGMKYWSCCKRKTSDFTSFLNQEGCSKGTHVWKKPREEKTTCRYDWHQTGPHVVLSVFAKTVNVELSCFEANQVKLKAGINFENGKYFELQLSLFGVIDPLRSKVTVSGTKVEVTLYKSRAMTWKSLGTVIEDEKDEEPQQEEVVITKNDTPADYEDSGSDLDGIDDVIFD